ncbi:MAG: formylglycine-generating enzyme family protein [Polyangiaceae bacterium]
MLHGGRRSVSARPAILAIATCTVAACSLFTDLSGLTGGSSLVVDSGGADAIADSFSPPSDAPITTPDAAKRFPSCDNDAPGAGAGCGDGHATDCCETLPVPGGTYNRYNDSILPATVSSFNLDRFEVTVGRFRAFLDQGGATLSNAPAADAGANPLIAGSGWDPAWNVSLSGTEASVSGALACESTSTWTDAPGANEELPINCMNWYEAFAFCVWDGGRLPTDTEWGYAASGGSDQRTYAWGNQAPDPTRTAWDDGGPLKVVGGYSPLGDAKWGQSEMTGNVQERLLDWYSSPLPPTCDDCAVLALTDAGGRMERGAGFVQRETDLPNSHVDADFPEVRYAQFGFRCAR